MNCVNKVFPRLSLKTSCLGMIIFSSLYILNYSGLILHFYELDYETNFVYPLEGDFDLWIAQMKKNLQLTVKPINEHDYKMLKIAKGTDL